VGCIVEALDLIQISEDVVGVSCEVPFYFRCSKWCRDKADNDDLSEIAEIRLRATCPKGREVHWTSIAVWSIKLE